MHFEQQISTIMISEQSFDTDDCSNGVYHFKMLLFLLYSNQMKKHLSWKIK